MKKVPKNKPELSLVIDGKAELQPSIVIPEPFQRLNAIESGIDQDFKSAHYRALQWGAEALEIKATMTHGQFWKALAEFSPDVPKSTASFRMQYAKSVLCTLTNVKDYDQIPNRWEFGKVSISKVLQSPKSVLTDEQAAFQKQVLETIQGKTMRQTINAIYPEDDPRRLPSPVHRGGHHPKRDEAGNPVPSAPRGANDVVEMPKVATEAVTLLGQQIAMMATSNSNFLALCTKKALDDLENARVALGREIALVNKQ